MDVDSDDEGRQSSSEPDIPRSPIHSTPSVSPTQGSARSRRKRRAEGFIERVGPPPFKRVKGDFNGAYVNLLNQDIRDASSGLIHSEEHPELGHTQIGAVVWSAAEKKVFFAAVSRLGKDDAAGISARIGTKSELEVRQYLIFLDAAKRRQHGDEGKGARHANPRPVDIPAAVEIGAECAAMLEAAADALSLRQEAYEEEVEKEYWGPQWLITPPTAQILEMDVQSRIQDEKLRDEEEERKGQPRLKEEDDSEKNRKLMRLLQLFPIPNWLQLSDRIFMNSAVSDSNWHAVSDEYQPPAIQTTVIEDLYGLVLSITRRLVLAVIYMAESRVRTRSLNNTRRRRASRIRVEDVTAAVVSLGMKQNSKEFWVRCARRLQLNIVNDEHSEDDFTDRENEDTDTGSSEDTSINDQLNTAESRPGSTEETEQESEESEEESNYEIMSYDEVETALGYPAPTKIRSRSGSLESYVSNTSERISSASEDETDGEHEEEYKEELTEEDDEYESDIKIKGPSHELDEDLNPDTIRRDMEEAMLFSAPVGVVPTRQVMKSRIRAEHRLEREAEHLDLKASADAETKLWALLLGDGDSKTKCHKS
ncbi:hypothetical protein ANO14919_015110 [Xylariales sp. No.14919]|nr:hypothetical protein ANO14919_015110 [Xylariales sp. No.14919]